MWLIAILPQSQVWIAIFLIAPSKEAQHVNPSAPPSLLNPMSSPTLVVPLEQLWTQIPLSHRQEVLRHLTQMLAQRIAPLVKGEACDE